jgi:hypothetical protein
MNAWTQKFKIHIGLRISRMPVILATQEAEIRRIFVQSRLRQIVRETLSQKTFHKNRAGGVTQGEDPQYQKKKKKREREI